MDATEIWRNKADEEVLAAYQTLSDYTDEGQQIIRAEFERRGLGLDPPAPVVEHAGVTAPVSGNPLKRLWNGDYSLPVTYWGWNVGGTLAWVVIFAALPGPNGLTAALVTLLLVLASTVYNIVGLVGIWRSAGKYTGNPAWGTLARVAVAMSVATTVVRVLAAIFR